VIRCVVSFNKGTDPRARHNQSVGFSAIQGNGFVPPQLAGIKMVPQGIGHRLGPLPRLKISRGLPGTSSEKLSCGLLDLLK
jgi:hypothetical protein